MHTVEVLEEALAVAGKLGYRVRHEWLDGRPGGACEIKGKKWIFLDPTLSPTDQLELVISALERDPALAGVQPTLALPLANHLKLRRSA